MAFKCGGRVVLAGLLALAGCSKVADPVGLLHDLRGGAIAAPRASTPGAEAPYPTLATVPGRPQTDDAAARGRIAAGLVADRANAQYATQSALGALPPVPSSALPRRPAPAPDSGMSASLDAAARTETPTSQPPRTAPVGRVAATPLAAPPTAPPAALATTPHSALPDVPEQPPAPASLPGLGRTTMPAPPPVALPAPPAAAVLPAGAPVAVGFPDGSATLPDAAIPQLRALAAQRAGRRIAVAGFGGAAEADQGEQARTLPLAWQRSAAIARALQAAGVPEAEIALTAQATGHGGVARLAE